MRSAPTATRRPCQKPPMWRAHAAAPAGTLSCEPQTWHAQMRRRRPRQRRRAGVLGRRWWLTVTWNLWCRARQPGGQLQVCWPRRRPLPRRQQLLLQVPCLFPTPNRSHSTRSPARYSQTRHWTTRHRSVRQPGCQRPRSASSRSRWWRAPRFLRGWEHPYSPWSRRRRRTRRPPSDEQWPQQGGRNGRAGVTRRPDRPSTPHQMSTGLPGCPGGALRPREAR